MEDNQLNEEKEIDKTLSFLRSYTRILVISSTDIKTCQLQKFRAELRQQHIILLKPRNVRSQV